MSTPPAYVPGVGAHKATAGPSIGNVENREGLYQYVLQKGLREDPFLKEIRENTQPMKESVMATPPDQLEVMKVILRLMNAKHCIEVGVFTGGGTLAMAQALPEDGTVVALDISEDFAKVGKPTWEKSPDGKKIDLRIGRADEAMAKMLEDPAEVGKYDFVFIDADKRSYPTYYEQALKLIRKGGIVAIDNTLWHGAVIKDSCQDDDTKAVREINDMVHADERIDMCMVVLGDGLTLCYKK